MTLEALLSTFMNIVFHPFAAMILLLVVVQVLLLTMPGCMVSFSSCGSARTAPRTCCIVPTFKNVMYLAENKDCEPLRLRVSCFLTVSLSRAFGDSVLCSTSHRISFLPSSFNGSLASSRSTSRVMPFPSIHSGSKCLRCRVRIRYDAKAFRSHLPNGVVHAHQWAVSYSRSSSLIQVKPIYLLNSRCFMVRWLRT